MRKNPNVVHGHEWFNLECDFKSEQRIYNNKPPNHFPLSTLCVDLTLLKTAVVRLKLQLANSSCFKQKTSSIGNMTASRLLEIKLV